MAKKKKGIIKLSKKALRKMGKITAIIIVLLIICYGIYSFYDFFKQSRINQIINERNLYCNTTWKDYINNEVINQTTESIYITKKCFYENQYVMDKLSSLCLCTFEVYNLTGTLINDNFTLLYSVFNDV